MRTLKGLVKLMRVELPVSAGICVVMGQILALGAIPSVLQMALGFTSIFLISASILVLNDYYDIETDKINAPHRPIPSGAVSPQGAFIWAVSLFLFGFSGGAFLSFQTLFLALLVSVIGFLYNRKYKKSGLPGNLMVSFSVGMTFVYGGFSVGYPLEKTVWYFAVLAALIDLGEEIAADAMDAKGDMIIRSKSLAIIYGRRPALNISGLIFTIVYLLSFLPFILGWFSLVYLIPVLIIDISIVYSTVKLLKSSGDEGRKYIRTLYLGATLGILVFVVMKAAGVQ
ncbi:MAG: UbiA family prenyltransferase [Ignavibacteriaceae bacterium]|nr:UbiA family prenyltransferase [Ignavibacteriaceae bacterium]